MWCHRRKYGHHRGKRQEGSSFYRPDPVTPSSMLTTPSRSSPHNFGTAVQPTTSPTSTPDGRYDSCAGQDVSISGKRGKFHLVMFGWWCVCHFQLHFTRRQTIASSQIRSRLEKDLDGTSVYSLRSASQVPLQAISFANGLDGEGSLVFWFQL